jgi:hypothetical protein
MNTMTLGPTTHHTMEVRDAEEGLQSLIDSLIDLDHIPLNRDSGVLEPDAGPKTDPLA